MKKFRPDRITGYFLAELPTLALITVSGIIYNIGMAAGPWFEGILAQYLYDILGGSRLFGDMLKMASLYIITIVFVQTMRYVKRFFIRRFANNTNRRMRLALYHELTHKTRRELENERVGSLMTKAIADVDACVEGLRKFTTELFDTGVVLIAYLGLLLSYDIRLTLLVCIFPLLAYFISGLLKKPVVNSASAYKESAGRLNGATLELVSGALTYRVFGCDAERSADYEEKLADYERKAAVSQIMSNALQPLYQALSMAGVIFIIIIGGKYVTGGEGTIWDIAAFATFLSCFAKLSLKSSKAAKLFNAVQKAAVSWKRIKPFFTLREDEPELCLSPAPLTVSGLGFAYPGGGKLIDGLSFTARPGEIIGVTGAVASGKSTLGRVFLCEYPYTGSIVFDGRELSELQKPCLRALCGYMGHDPELLDDTIAANIALGDKVDVSEYLAAAALTREVDALPDKALTMLGNNGVRLSGGQQARVAFARTLCHMRPIVVLDDPFSALDRATELTLYAALRKYAADSIVLLISHRLYLFPSLDGVIWLEDGGAVMQSHDGLMKTNGQYSRLYRAQLGADDKPEVQTEKNENKLKQK